MYTSQFDLVKNKNVPKAPFFLALLQSLNTVV